MIRHLFNTIFICLIFANYSQAQTGKEVLVELESMPMGNAPVDIVKNEEILELPFFDDFSRDLHYPTPELWEGKHVFVNTNYAINPRVVGVATFDAINSKGILHHNASIIPFSADTLTSYTINLSYPGDTTIYLSFYYQPQGYGNEPQAKDSLLLEFFDSTDDTWVGVWASSPQLNQNKIVEKYKLTGITKTIESDTLYKSFIRVHFPVKDSRFLSDGFRLRFRNIASLAENQHVPSIRGNCDHWHLDLVFINRNRAYNDTILDDVTFYRPLSSVLKNYESIPWKHFHTQAQIAELPSPFGFPIHYRNLGSNTRNVSRYFTFYNHSSENLINYFTGFNNLSPFKDTTYNLNYIYDLESTWADSAKFTFKSYLFFTESLEKEYLRWNDTVRYVQRFHNYYAYDDGTAEMGWGMYGEGTQNARAAVKFNSYLADSLVGVYIYFNRTFDDANQKYFKLAVWNDNNGSPGELIYEQLGVRPLFTDSLNRFTLYRLNEPLWIEDETFYIGWIQTTIDMLNMGFDMNRISDNKLFYNISGQWTNTLYEGSLMLRPVFGSLTEPPTSITSSVNNFDISIFPNPAQNHFTVNLSPNDDHVSIRVFSITGQLVLSNKLSAQPIDIGSLPNGIYIIQLSTSKSIIGTRKLIISR
jgi:hypothetical protein